MLLLYDPRMYILVAVFFLSSLGALFWQQSQIQQQSTPGTGLQTGIPLASEPIEPIPLYIRLDEQKVDLGNQLFHEPRLSDDNSISCASCHHLDTGGVDRLPTPIGLQGAVGHLNTPTVFNSGFNFRQFWDGRADSLETQVEFPIHAPHEMGSNWPDIIAKLQTSPDYVSAFNASYEDGITSANIQDAIATFERSLYTPNSRFDQYLRGEQNALSERERKGYQLFKSYGCVSCHQGMNVGGNIYQKLGIFEEYFGAEDQIQDADLGRFNLTKNEKDRYVFKVPSLRNVALTAPYFHNGSISSLEEAIAIMGRYQLGRHISGEDILAIADFLRTLTGEYNGVSLEDAAGSR